MYAPQAIPPGETHPGAGFPRLDDAIEMTTRTTSDEARRTLGIAHRGAAAEAPENTIAAFELAVEQRADGIELEVQLTRDEHPVVINDFTLDRTTDGKGYVRDR